MAQSFAQRLKAALASSGSLVCVGLDPDPAKIPPDLGDEATRLQAFGRRIVDATYDIAAVYKPQIAFYSAQGAELQLESTIRYIRERAPQALIILDAKRGDIGNTAEAYAREAFDRYGADAVTVNPYMGEDSVLPFLARMDRGAVILCRTSNPGGQDFQNLILEGLPLYRHVARRATGPWNALGNVMLVVGATCPAEMAELRAAHPDVTFLVPGIGAQNGDLKAVLAAGLDAQGSGLLISASRSIIYAGGGTAAAIRAAAAQLHREINAERSSNRAATMPPSRPCAAPWAAAHSARLGLQRGIHRHGIHFIDDAVLHHEGHLFHEADVVDRIAGHRHHVGDLAGA